MQTREVAVGEVAMATQVSRRSVLRWIHAGKIEARPTPGGEWRCRVYVGGDADGWPVPR